MALVPLPVEELDDLLVIGNPSGPQYAAYWGRTKQERYNRFLESAIVTVIGTFFSYFLSFVVGGFMATLFGAMFAFWAILSPEFKARQRNWEFLGGRALVDPWSVIENREEDEQGLYGSIFLGRVEDVCVVEDTASMEEFELDEFEDYSMDTDELEQLAGTPYLIRVRVNDEDGREMQIHARMSEEYADVRVGMPVVTVLLSKSQSFSSLAALTDVMIPDADCWVGDYPYLNRPEMETLLAEDDELWNALQAQGIGDFSQDSSRGDLGDNKASFDGRDNNNYSEDYDKVPARRRKY